MSQSIRPLYTVTVPLFAALCGPSALFFLPLLSGAALAQQGPVEKLETVQSRSAAEKLVIAQVQVFPDEPEQPAAAGQAATGQVPTGQVPVKESPADLKSYYSDMWNRINKKWWVPEELQYKPVVLNMVVESDGSLSAISIDKSSGDKRADTLALIGVRRAAPFAPLPPGLPSPFHTRYSIGFQPHANKDVLYYDGKRYEKNEAVTLATGTRLKHTDLKTSELDKQFHLKKEAALIKMNALDDQLEALQKKGGEPLKQADLLTEYSQCLSTIQEQGEALGRLSQALELFDKNQAEPSRLYPCLSQLAQLKYSVGDLPAAEPLFKRAIEIQDKLPYQSRDPQYKDLLQAYGKLLYKQNRAQEADEIYKKLRS